MERTYIRFSGCDFCAGRVVETLGDGTVQWGWRPDGEPMGASRRKSRERRLPGRAHDHVL
jgi:hypothetical protein